MIFRFYGRMKRSQTRIKYRIAILALRREILERSVFLNITYTDAMKMKRICGVTWWKHHAIHNRKSKEIIFT